MGGHFWDGLVIGLVLGCHGCQNGKGPWRGVSKGWEVGRGILRFGMDFWMGEDILEWDDAGRVLGWGEGQAKFFKFWMGGEFWDARRIGQIFGCGEEFLDWDDAGRILGWGECQVNFSIL